MRVPDDNRKRPDRSPCRKILDLSFLTGIVNSTGSTNVSYYLHEAQTSLLIVGNNNTVWTAYLFTDTYHNGRPGETNHEDLSFFQQPSASEENELFYDPLTMGQHDANVPIWDPREYFCLIVRIRLGLIKEEWAYIFSLFAEKIGAFVRSPHHASFDIAKSLTLLTWYLQKLDIPSFLEPTGLGSAEAHAHAIEDAYDWITKATRILHCLTSNLTRVIQTWSSFFKDNIRDFLEGSSEQLKLSLQKIRISMNELREILADLNDLMQKAENFIHEVGLHRAGNRRRFQSD